MKKIFVSAGLAAIGVATLESAVADDITSPKYWNVGATLRGFYDDNYNITGTQRGSFGLELDPFISFHEPFQQTDVGIRYTYGLYYYQDRNDVGVNPFDQTHQLDMWVDHAFNEQWHGRVNDTFAVGQEPELLNPNPVNGVAVPYRVNGDNISNHGSMELDTDWTRLFSTTLTYANSYYDYDNSGGVINSSGAIVTGGVNGPSLAGILDRDEESIALDLDWHVKPDTTLLIGYSFNWVNYLANEPIAIITTPLPFVYHSGDRDSDSHVVYLGVVEEFTSNLSANVRAGFNYNDVYGDPLFPSTSISPYADLSVVWTYSPGSYVQLGFTHDISSTDQVAPDNQGKITQYSEDSVVYVDLNHKITSKLTATIIGRMQYDTYNAGAAASQDSTDYGLGLNLSYQINQHFSVDAGYNYDDVVTQISGYAYSRNRVYLGLTANY